MSAVNVMRIRRATPLPEPQEREATADDAGADVTAGVLGLILATMRVPIEEPDAGLGDDGAMRDLTASERRKKALRMGYAACLLPG